MGNAAHKTIIDANRLTSPWNGDLPPCLLVDLAREDEVALAPFLPPCPVIGLGDRSHPLARQIDCVIEPPVQPEGLVRNIAANPHASSILVQLLRMIEDMPVADALVAESLAYAVLQAGDEHARWLARNEAKPSPGRAGAVDLTRDGGCLIITVNRPEAANAVDVAVREGLREALELAVLDPEILEVELRGAGKAFGVGADLSEFGTTRDPAMAHAIRMQTLPAHAAARCANKLTGYVQGLCMGSSLELAGFASRIVAQKDAVFRLNEVAMGILPGAGGCVSISRRIGRQRAALMMLSGRRIGAGTALDWGLVDDVVDEIPRN